MEFIKSAQIDRQQKVYISITYRHRVWHFGNNFSGSDPVEYGQIRSDPVRFGKLHDCIRLVRPHMSYAYIRKLANWYVGQLFSKVIFLAAVWLNTPPDC